MIYRIVNCTTGVNVLRSSPLVTIAVVRVTRTIFYLRPIALVCGTQTNKTNYQAS